MAPFQHLRTSHSLIVADFGLFRAMQELQIRFQPESSVSSAMPGSISSTSDAISGKTFHIFDDVILTGIIRYELVVRHTDQANSIECEALTVVGGVQCEFPKLMHRILTKRFKIAEVDVW